MSTSKLEATYKGKRIEEMTREELIDAVFTLSSLYMKSMEQRQKDFRVFVGEFGSER